MGIRYLDMLESLGRLGAQTGLPDFIAVDEAAWLSGRATRRKSTLDVTTKNCRSRRMPWRDSLQQLKAELTQARATRMERLEAYDQEVAAEREELLSRHESLNVTALVLEMNEVLLDGQGEVETTVEWETGEEEEEPIYDDETADVISTALSWDEGEELEVVVELAMLDEGLSLMVNGVQIRQDRNALERALIDAFREQLQL